MKRNKRNNKSGFTLAEVLITLGIIGVVATLTIPTLIKNNQKQQTLSKLQKSYSAITQAIKLSEADNGPASTWIWRYYGAADIYHEFSTYFAPYLKINKYCYSYLDCNYPSGFSQINGTGDWGFGNNNNDRLGVILQDGTLFFILDKTTWNTGPQFYIDINGSLPPNKNGKDVFIFYINATKGFVPYDYPANPCTVSNGYGCGSKIIQEGWQINSDYPW